MRSLLYVGLVTGLVAGCSPGGPDPLIMDAMLAAEDSRGVGPNGLTPLLEGLASEYASARAVAVRALGRLERPDLVGEILPLILDDNPNVRREAVNALAQAVSGVGGEEVADMLTPRVSEEPDSVVRGVLARTIGRLTLQGEALSRAQDQLVQLSWSADGTSGEDAPTVTLVGVALGFETVARTLGPREELGAEARNRLEELVFYARRDSLSGVADGRPSARVRSLAVSALTQAGAADSKILSGALSDPDAEVRRQAVRGLGGGRSSAELIGILRELGDVHAGVRAEAIAAYRRSGAAVQSCLPVIGLTADPDPDVRQAAIDYLGRSCREGAVQAATLQDIAEGLVPSDEGGWQAAAHALVALARVAPHRVSAVLLDRFATHPSPYVRAYAARSSGLLADIPRLQGLAEDDNANVRSTAIGELGNLQGHLADSVVTAQLDQDDPQLVLTAARLLEGAKDTEIVLDRVLAAFHRVSAERRETSRDPRLALLARIGEFGGADQAAELEPYLSDFDARVAEEVARLLTAWTGTARTAAPIPLPRLELPKKAELDRLARSDVVLEMRRGGIVRIRLLPAVAPTNAARFARLVGSGYFDGLDFHRVEPNFVIQGGSPGANEYSGAGPYTRDEVGVRSHWRGTVGLSTRGRDTGDAQIFINLVDNVRLDHNYTVFGEVVEGMDVVDAVLEGDVIESARVEER
ncbi:MAG: peptidylprolyl isomerase [Gemmatimonadota bacterium]|nr:MAG: peptidylprolyl isomerase [Gemmatimonadota bacterium]